MDDKQRLNDERLNDEQRLNGEQQRLNGEQQRLNDEQWLNMVYREVCA